MDGIQTVETVPPQGFDISQFAPLVTEFQKGEVEKSKIAHEGSLAIAQLNTQRQMEVDKYAAAREIRHDAYEGITTGLLYAVCLAMIAYGMWAHDSGFITAGVTSFASFLAGKRSAAIGKK